MLISYFIILITWLLLGVRSCFRVCITFNGLFHSKNNRGFFHLKQKTENCNEFRLGIQLKCAIKWMVITLFFTVFYPFHCLGKFYLTVIFG